MGADPTIPGPAGTPLEIAAKTNQKEIEESLREFAGLEMQRRSTIWKTCRVPTSKVDLKQPETDSNCMIYTWRNYADLLSAILLCF